MTLIFEAAVGMKREDFAGLGEAMRWVEHTGHGRVTTFVRDFDGRDRSSAMRVYKDGVWRSIDIHE